MRSTREHSRRRLSVFPWSGTVRSGLVWSGTREDADVQSGVAVDLGAEGGELGHALGVGVVLVDRLVVGLFDRTTAPSSRSGNSATTPSAIERTQSSTNLASLWASWVTWSSSGRLANLLGTRADRDAGDARTDLLAGPLLGRAGRGDDVDSTLGRPVALGRPLARHELRQQDDRRNVANATGRSVRRSTPCRRPRRGPRSGRRSVSASPSSRGVRGRRAGSLRRVRRSSRRRSASRARGSS